MDVADDPAAALRAFEPPQAAAGEWASFVAAWAALRADAAWPADLDAAIRWYVPQLRRLHDDAAPREADLAQLARLARGYATRERFVTELTLDPPDATSDESDGGGRDEDYLVLSTIHSAKGQEWTAVVVLNAVDGCIPSDMATGSPGEIEEERRLLYVAMTRARQHLQLVVPQRFHVTHQPQWGDRHVYASLTRFIPPPVAECFDRVAPPRLSAAAAAIAPPGPRVDVAARINASWA
jgi:DNA helicase-2/ATP-dependent DNA helicase PcrA